MQADYDVLIPAWNLKQPKAQGMTYGVLHFTKCRSTFYGQAKKHPDCKITYNDKVELRSDAINTGSIAFEATHQPAETLTPYYHKWLLLFNPHKAEQLPNHRPHNHEIIFKVPDDQNKVGPIYQLSREEERLL
jgi:hypothetical protein